MALDGADRTSQLLAGANLGAEAAELLRAIMAVDLLTDDTQPVEIDSPLPEADR